MEETPIKRKIYPELAKESLLSAANRPDPENRLWAKSIDAGLIQLMAYFLKISFGALPCILFIIFCWSLWDLINEGQSPGKWLLGLHTIETQRGTPIKYDQSIARNLPFMLLALGVMFYLNWWGKVFLLVGTLCTFFELYTIFQVASGVRVGDIVGRTRVFDYKDQHTLFLEQFLKDNEPE